MHDSHVIAQERGRSPPRWLLLIHQVPHKPDYLRVKVRRQLQRIGAIALKNSVYVLPRTDETMEDFQWVRRLVVDQGGEATVCLATFVDGVTDGELESMFRTQSNAEYQEIIDSVRSEIRSMTVADTARLERHLGQVQARDFFSADHALEAERVLRAAKESLKDDRPGTTQDLEGTRPHGATWVTRTGVQIDRIASAWLIRRFVDPAGRIKFVAPDGYCPESGELRFDMFEGEYTHEGEDCTFEVLVRRFALGDPALTPIAEVVHDLDCKDEKFGRDETVGVALMIRGITTAHEEDQVRLEAGAALFDGLYAAFGHEHP